ncbi:MAG: hypothetical protein AAF762_14065 [Pseudomonadota bacterium]
MRAISWFLVSAGILLPLAFVAAVILLPGPHRAVAPGAFALTAIAPGVYTDAVGRRQDIAAMLAAADANAAAFFGAAHPRWRTIVCTAQPCREAFGIPGRGLSIADMVVLVAPSGVREETLFHEQIHIELNARMGPLDALLPRYPSWFNEGLATHLSGTPAVHGPDRVTDAQWITAARTPLGWRRAKRGRTVAEYYGAAARVVAGIEERIGRDGLVRLIEEVADGAAFDAALDRAMGR